MDQWLTALSKDTSNDQAIVKIRRAKPAGLVDACWTKDGQKIVEKQRYHGRHVQRALPVAFVPARRCRRADYQRHDQVPAQADRCIRLQGRHVA